MGDLLQLRVVALDLVLFGAQIVEALDLPQHAGVGAGHAGDGEHADESTGEEDVEVVNGDGNLAELPLGIACDKKDVPAFPQRTLLTETGRRGLRPRCGKAR